MFSPLLVAEGYLEASFPELRSNRDTAFPFAVPGAVVAQLQYLAGHD